MLFIPHKLQQQFLLGLPPSPPLSPTSSSSSSPPPSSIKCNEQAPHERASQLLIQSPSTLYPYPPKINVAHNSLHGLDGASLSPSFGTTRPALSQTPIADRFTRPGFTFTITDSLTESWRQPASSTSLESQVSNMSNFNPSTLSPLRFSRTSSPSMDFLVGTRPLSTLEQGFHVAEEHFIQEIGGAGPDIKPPYTPSLTIIDIQHPSDDAGHHEQSPVQPSKTLQNIKKSLLGRLVKKPWTRIRRKSDRTSKNEEPPAPQPLNISATSDQEHRPHRSNNNHIHNIQLERPAQFPFPTKTANHPHLLRQPTNSAEVQKNTAMYLDESRHRERQHRRALKRLKSIGQFRRRPNLIPKMTEGRTTEPVEVARIRRAYTQRSPDGRRLGQSERMKESLLERVNRQMRAQVQEWRVTRLSLSQSQVQSSSLMSTPATAVVTVPLHDEAVESRPSMRWTISTRVPESRSTCKGGNPTLAPKTRFAFHWNRYVSKKLAVLRESPQETELAHEDERKRSSSHRSEQRSPCHSQVPRLLRRCNSLTSRSRASAPSSPIYLTVHAGSTLSTLESSIARNRHSYMSRPNLDSAPNSRRSSRFLLPIAEASNRLSVVSMVSCNSAVSAVSSMANSIYSVLSEDWNRPFFFAQSKSRRCPTSFQNNVRALPPYDQITASITITRIQKANTRQQMTAASERVRSRSLRNQDGSVFQLTPGHELQSNDIRITWREVKDSLGFIEYDDNSDEDEEESQDQRHQSTIPDITNIPTTQCDVFSECPGTDDWILGGPSKPILDVNDTSAMIAAGIDPSEPHPNPESFYCLHHPAEHQASIQNKSQEISTGADTGTPSSSSHHELSSGLSSDDLVDNSTFTQYFHSVFTKTMQPITKYLQKTQKSRVVQKWICKPLKGAFSSQSQRSTHCTVTEIRRAGPGLDRSHSDTVNSASAKEWLRQLPGGHASAGRFDRDWLDAQPFSSSSSFAQRDARKNVE
ncbi:hypothetical protein BGZ90_011182 [Linnemannia elongata]|nr:hypothetical protein BGZ90_011182 [Linnemannia elongata]